jgi:hypothetical protein
MADRRRAFQFFMKESGYVVGKRAQGSLDLARAEAYALDHGWTTEWVGDDSGSDALGDHEYWCSNAKRGKCDGHYVFGCVLNDNNGEHLASLWGIIEPSSAYERVVEAELASEALYDAQVHQRMVDRELSII